MTDTMGPAAASVGGVNSLLEYVITEKILMNEPSRIQFYSPAVHGNGMSCGRLEPSAENSDLDDIALGNTTETKGLSDGDSVPLFRRVDVPASGREMSSTLTSVSPSATSTAQASL